MHPSCRALPVLNNTHQTIGLLGGSFHPPHEGHVHISLEAARRLQLDGVWWLVSPHNPLKAKAPAPLQQRMGWCEEITRAHNHITVTDIEAHIGTRYTVDTLCWLHTHLPNTRFVWLMGADNLAHFHRWKDWQTILELVPMAVMDRTPHHFSMLHAKAALYAKQHRIRTQDAALLPELAPPAWVYLPIARNPLSSTQLRDKAASTAS